MNNIEENDAVAISLRKQPFITIDHDVLKQCRERGEASPEMLLTYFTIQEMAASGEWAEGIPLSEDRISELSGLGLHHITSSLDKLEGMGAFA